MKEVILYEETWIFIDDSVHSDSRFVGWMRGRGHKFLSQGYPMMTGHRG